MGHGHYLNETAAHHQVATATAAWNRAARGSSPQSASSPASSPPSISPPGSSSSPATLAGAGAGAGAGPQLVATFKLPKTCTACGKAIKTQGKVCAKCKMRKYRERKKEQEHSLKVQ